MWHLQPVLTPVAYVARHLGPGLVYGDPYEAIALISPSHPDSVLIHGTLSKRGDISRDQWRDLLLKVVQECGVTRIEADRKKQRCEFTIEGGVVKLRHLGPSRF
ncbi:hypothetical protein [Paucibacter sp. Y2R2-4]|uniref:hypothetical protein n=1 Tax=Paucibacter sp. Y2R2-4 TaxID=2893553 RepID=UPI0021E43D7C|nr:hypothetical protein [Paucibacter sp. Y2R2-4]MCV2349349.1 hypothetical protein [Paucibacter sp. Y2R2-4]